MDVIERTLQRLREHLDLDITYISELVGDDMIVRAVCAPHLPDVPDNLTVPRKIGFCHYMAAGEIPQIIQDTSKDPIAANLPLRSEFNIQSYIGVPLDREDGTRYGTICGLGHAPNRSLNERDLRSVKLFSELVVGQIDRELEDRKQSVQRVDRISEAIEQELFSIHYQPIVNLQTRDIKGFEALCRFHATPYRSPDKWFNEAAQIGMGVELELVAIEHAIEALNALPDDISLSLNVSPECLKSEALSDVLSYHPAERIIFEVTEHVMVDDYDGLLAHIARHKDRGVRLAVDDAGAGYASLNHIVQLQPDIIKLDMSLTRNIHNDRIRRSLANALIFFARETNAKIVAEGIETQGECETLARLGADYGQGYLFSKPLPFDEACDAASAPCSEVHTGGQPLTFARTGEVVEPA